MREHDISGMSWVVTQQDIESGIAIDCKKCPHARAFSRLFNWNCTVESHGIFCGFRSVPVLQFRFRSETSKWISDFDNGWVEYCHPGLHSARAV